MNPTSFRTIAPFVLITILGFLLAYQFVDPAPPKRISIGSGDEQGGYFLFANRYREYLKKEGIELQVKPTAGSIDNLHLLTGEEVAVDAAFVQGGSAGDALSNELFSLGSLYFEPLWVFIRGSSAVQRITELAGRRIAIGESGSGTQQLALQLLSINGLNDENTSLFPLGANEATTKLMLGEVDVVFMVASAKSPAVRQLLTTDDIHLMSFDRSEAYTRNFRFLSNVILPEGAIDLEKNIPLQDTVLLAATANLVVREDLHPALIDLLLQAAQAVHGEGGWFEGNGQFPAPDHLEFPLSPDARRFYRYGAPLLQRYLPFWAASFVDRMKVMLLPLIALLIPFVKIMPPIYRWRMRSKVYRWYRELQEIELGQFHHVPAPKEHYQRELDRIESEVAKVDVPLSFADELFNLRLHIEMIRRRLEANRLSPLD